MLLSFDRLQDRPGVEIVDHVERRQCTVRTDEPVELGTADPEAFTFPVDQAARIQATRLELPHRMAVLVRNSLGYQVQELTKGDAAALPTDRYSIDLAAPVKLYLIAESAVEITVTDEAVRLDFDGPTEVLLGARSYHKHPAGTITTTEDPEDVMAAVSALSSALKTTSVERSYPTLRGHPPTIELGDELDIPAGLEPPETGVRIEVPPALEYVYVAAPLAYYLGARLEPGPAPRLVTEAGFEHALDVGPAGFEAEVARVLKQVFFLDCLTRTEGFYPVNLHERNALEADLDLDFAALYDAPLAEQLEAYLAVPYGLIEPELPEWKLTAQVAMTPTHVEVLPFLINDLAVIRSPVTESPPVQATASSTVDETRRRGEFTRRSTAEAAPSPTLVRPAATDSLEQAWVGEGAPIGASKAMIEAYRNRLYRSPTDGDIDITVVCNDTAMNDERDIVDDIYGSRQELPFDVRGHQGLTVEELRSVLEEEIDFLHYIGHIDERGFECADGFLDATTLDHTGVEAFLLNACTSYEQGMGLIRAGSIAGVVTVEDVINSGAERIGSSLAKLLNHGFPFGSALNIARGQSIVGGQYLVLGDAGIDIAQSDAGVPGMCEVRIDESGRCHTVYQTFPTVDRGIGCLTIPHAGDNDEFYLASGQSGEFVLSKQELIEFVTMDVQPLMVGEKLHWSDGDLDSLLDH